MWLGILYGEIRDVGNACFISTEYKNNGGRKSNPS